MMWNGVPLTWDPEPDIGKICIKIYWIGVPMVIRTILQDDRTRSRPFIVLKLPSEINSL